MNEISRRQMILAMTASPLALAGLAGCGGGGAGAGSSNLGVTSTAGTVALPSGFSLPMTTLKVETGLGSSALQANRGFTVNTLAQATGPTLAWLRTDSKVVLAGFIDSGHGVIDARSTALALLFFALGGQTIPAAEKAHLLQLIDADSTVGPLASVIALRIAANPTALADGDAQIGSALKTAVDALRSHTPSRSVKLGADSRAGRLRSVSRTDDFGSLLQLSPAGLQSNVEVLQGDPPQSIIATNHARRYCSVFVYEIGTENKAGVRTDHPKAKLAMSSVSLFSTRALGVLSTIFGFFKRDTAFVPVSTSPITLSQANGVSKTFFEVVVLGSSTLLFDPGFFSEARYADEVTAWREELTELNLISWLGDIVFGLLLEVWGLRSLTANQAAVDAAIKSFRSLEGGAWAHIALLAGSGKLIEATKEFLLFSTESAETAVRIRAALAALLPEVGGSIGATEAAAGAKICLAMFQAAFAAAGVVLGAVDIGAVLYDLANSERGERWQATLVRQEVRISPAAITLKPGDGTSFSATIPGGTAGTIVYKWTVAASFAVLTDTTSGKSGRTFETSSAHVSLATTPSDRSNITVTVEALRVGDGGARTSLGTAQSAVTMKEEEDVPLGSVRVRLSNVPGTDLDQTLVRDLDRVRAQQVPAAQGAKVPILVESVHELVANFGPKNTQLFMLLDFGTAIKKGQSVDATLREHGVGLNMRLGGPTTGGAAVRFVATSGSIIVDAADVSSDSATIKFHGTAAMARQDDPGQTFTATLNGWISDIKLLA
jgi:hypothetical protein